MNSVYLERGEDGSWQSCGNFPVSREPSLRHSEGEHTRALLKLDVPLLLGPERFLPLCKEFPSSPGVDLIYVGDRGTLALIECEVEQYLTFNTLIRKTLHRGVKYSACQLMAIAAHIQRRPDESSANALAYLTDWMKSAGHQLDQTLEDLIDDGGVVFISLVHGALEDASLPVSHVPFAKCGVRLQDYDRRAILQVAGPTSSGSITRQWDELQYAFSAHEQFNRENNKPRPKTKVTEAIGYFLGLSDCSPTRRVLEAMLRCERMVPECSTAKDWNQKLRIRYPRGARKPATILSLEYEDKINIHGAEMRVDSEIVGTSEDRVDAMIRTLEDAVPRRRQAYTVKNHYLQLELKNLDPEQRDTLLLSIISELSEVLGEPSLLR